MNSFEIGLQSLLPQVVTEENEHRNGGQLQQLCNGEPMLAASAQESLSLSRQGNRQDLAEIHLPLRVSHDPEAVPRHVLGDAVETLLALQVVGAATAIIYNLVFVYAAELGTGGSGSVTS